jgi:hypothetical protein
MDEFLAGARQFLADHYPRAARTERERDQIACQLFSEPGAGCLSTYY